VLDVDDGRAFLPRCKLRPLPTRSDWRLFCGAVQSIFSVVSVRRRMLPGTLVLDPFCGSASLLISAAHFGSYTLGGDIDIRVIRGKEQDKAMPAHCRFARTLKDVQIGDPKASSNVLLACRRSGPVLAWERVGGSGWTGADSTRERECADCLDAANAASCEQGGVWGLGLGVVGVGGKDPPRQLGRRRRVTMLSFLSSGQAP
jgi:hypothetical protein